MLPSHCNLCFIERGACNSPYLDFQNAQPWDSSSTDEALVDNGVTANDRFPSGDHGLYFGSTQANHDHSEDLSGEGEVRETEIDEAILAYDGGDRWWR